MDYKRKLLLFWCVKYYQDKRRRAKRVIERKFNCSEYKADDELCKTHFRFNPNEIEEMTQIFGMEIM